MTGIQVGIFEDSCSKEWDQWIQSAPKATVFHRDGWLRRAAEDSGTRLIRFVCQKEGEGPVCLIPGFVQRKGPFRILHSPPPGCGIPYLGPVFLHRSERQHRVEADRIDSVTAWLEYIEDSGIASLLRIVAAPGIDDVRPFLWKGFRANPLYTYCLDLSQGEKEIREGFDKRIRKRIQTRFETSGVEEVTNTGLGIAELHELLMKKYADQGRLLGFSVRYLNRLNEVFGDTEMGFRGFKSNGRLLTGVVYLKTAERWTAWIGGVGPPKEYNGLVEQLHWKNIQEAIAANVKIYERIGANTPHLCESKSKYNFRPVSYFELIRGTLSARGALCAYKWIRRKHVAEVD